MIADRLVVDAVVHPYNGIRGEPGRHGDDPRAPDVGHGQALHKRSVSSIFSSH
jgi:hypothetical protein